MPQVESNVNSNRHQRYRRHANPFHIRGEVSPIDLVGMFGRQAPLGIDVGCGEGTFLCHMGQSHPEWNVLGFEIRPHLVAATQGALRQAGVVHGTALLNNASTQLRQLLPKHSIAMITVNFPDPWYKSRHHKRRVIQPDWLLQLAPLLQEGATFHLMTDYAPIAHECREYCEGMPFFVNLSGVNRFAESSTTGWPSERERLHISRGEKIFRLAYQCVPSTKTMSLS